MPCLDTNILVGVLKREEAALIKIRSLEEQGLRLRTTSINACELYKGAHLSKNPEKKIHALEGLIANIEILDINLETVKIAAKIMSELQTQGKTIDDMDVLIAAAAIKNNETLVTRDQDFKRIKQLRIETW